MLPRLPSPWWSSNLWENGKLEHQGIITENIFSEENNSPSLFSQETKA